MMKNYEKSMRAPIVKIKSLAGTYQGDEGSCIGQNDVKIRAPTMSKKCWKKLQWKNNFGSKSYGGSNKSKY
jgi:hypothetical protein